MPWKRMDVLAGTRHQGQYALDQLEGCENDGLGSVGERRLNRSATRPSGSGVSRSVAMGGRAR
jgi:hypothetical protein